MWSWGTYCLFQMELFPLCLGKAGPKIEVIN